MGENEPKIGGRALSDRLESMDCRSLGFMGTGRERIFVLGQRKRKRMRTKMERKRSELESKQLIKEIGVKQSTLKAIQKMVRFNREIKALVKRQGEELRVKEKQWGREVVKRELKIKEREERIRLGIPRPELLEKKIRRRLKQQAKSRQLKNKIKRISNIGAEQMEVDEDNEYFGTMVAPLVGEKDKGFDRAY